MTLATLTIVVDVRVPDLDVVADVVGGVLVLIGALRIHGVIKRTARAPVVPHQVSTA